MSQNETREQQKVVRMSDLLESGAHFGHQTRRWNPKMAPYIYTSRKDIYIIDLAKTAQKINEAYQALFEIAKNGKSVLFVGTKKQASQAIREEATRSGQFYIDTRWLGGTLTNFKTINKRIRRLHDLYSMEQDGTFTAYTKKEVSELIKERDRLEKFLGGIKHMKKLPGALFIVDPKKERNAILEARRLNIPVFGIVDTNCDPDDVDYVIPANDDANRAVKLIASIMANAVLEANDGKAPVHSAPRTNNKRNFDRKDNKRNFDRKDNRRDNNNNRRDNNRPQGNRNAKPASNAASTSSRPSRPARNTESK